MKTTSWNNWVEEKGHTLGETSQHFLRDSVLHSVKKNEVTFLLHEREITFKKLSASSWTMPSSLFGPYGSLSGIFTGLNVLLEENDLL